MSDFVQDLTWLLSLDGRVWSASILNVFALAFGLREVISQRDASNVSFWMLVIFLYMQSTYAWAGWQSELWGQFWGMLFSAFITTAFIIVKLFIYPGDKSQKK